MGKPNVIAEYEVMPQVAHKNAASHVEKIKLGLQLVFNALELTSLIFLFIFLYFYRLSAEFGYSLWDRHGLGQELPRFNEYAIFFFLVLTLWLAWSYRFKLIFNTEDEPAGFFDELMKSVQAISYSVLLTIGIAFIFKLEDYSRFVVLAFLLLSILTLTVLRSIKYLITAQLKRKGVLYKHVVIIGTGKVSRLIAQELEAQKELGYHVLGFVSFGFIARQKEMKILGTIDQMTRILRKYPVDEVFITAQEDKQKINEFIHRFRKYNIKIRIVPEMFNMVSKTVQVTSINAIPYLTLVKTPMRGLALYLKKLFDKLLAAFGLLCLLPLFAVVGILIKLDSKGPIFYAQQRVGKDGRIFKMYKFRSMVQDAEELQRILEERNEVQGNAFKLKNDPRVTKVGRFIRKYSIDELPQLFNVLKGDMSLIGPRPPLPKEVDRYSDWEWRRLEVTPGITGMWQVSGRSELSFDQWVNLDIYYIENWSLFLDLKILLKTIPVVVKGEGAY